MLKPEDQLSEWYQRVKKVLGGGWSGTYAALGRLIGYDQVTRRFAQIIGRLVKSYALRHPSWDHNNVFSQRTGRPAYEG